MARRDDDEGRGRSIWLLLLLIILLLGIFVLWRWWSAERNRINAEAPTAVEEIKNPTPPPALPEPEPEIEPEPEVAPAPEFALVEPVAEPEPADLPPPVPDNFSFSVYFDLMKWNLTAAAAQEIQSQLAVIDDLSLITSVQIDGHADLAGTNAYNQPLSMRRAQRVRRFLIDEGVAPRVIEIDGYGEMRPATPTADGVREPLNRRVTVTIRFD